MKINFGKLLRPLIRQVGPIVIQAVAAALAAKAAKKTLPPPE